MELRDYQLEAVDNCFESLKQGNNPLICLPTGSGKSIVAATLAKELSKRGKVLIATHRKELVEQNSLTLAKIADDDLLSIYSASCKSKDLTGQVVFAQIQSLHRAAEIPDFRYIIIDEAHLCPPEGEGMYQTLFARLPESHRIGLTATPYRMGTGNLHEGENALFNHLCVHVKARDLIPQYLSKLVGITNEHQIDVQGVHSRRGDFVTSELEQIVCRDEIVKTTCDEMLGFAHDRNHIVIFATSINHAEMIVSHLGGKGEKIKLVTGNTKLDLREEYLQSFSDSEIRFLINVGVLTTGVDLPLIDCLVLMRPTQSKGLHVQILGRAMRRHPGKEDALILDFSGNMLRHGDIDEFLHEHRNIPAEIEKRELEKKRKNRKQRPLYLGAVDQTTDPLNVSELQELEVKEIKYFAISAASKQGLLNVIAEYHCGKIKIKKWLCPEYQSGASWYAWQWLKNRGYNGTKITNAWKFITAAKALPAPKSISVFRNNKGYIEIKIEHFEL